MNTEYASTKLNTPCEECEPCPLEFSEELLRIILKLKETKQNLIQARRSIDNCDLSPQEKPQEPTCHYDSIASIRDLSNDLLNIAGGIAQLLR